MKPINQFLVSNDIRIATNPCISPDFCLNWGELKANLSSEKGIVCHHLSSFETSAGEWTIVEDANGDHAWRLQAIGFDSISDGLEDGCEIGEATYFPATYENLIAMKNLVQKSDVGIGVFPTAGEGLGRSTLGIGARFTSLPWPGVDWAMANLGLGMTANQNSIPRELVFDVNVMLADKLDTVPFPFIGTSVPEGHQGQSVEGMSHGCVLTKLKNGFHRNGIAWSFNADHQPIGGKFDDREDALVAGCLFASYITFDLSPELAQTELSNSTDENQAYVDSEIGEDLVSRVASRVGNAGIELNTEELNTLLRYVWPSMLKMKTRDDKYRAAREKAFTTEVGRQYLRELSIDELPGLTTPETTAVMLSLCEEMGIPVDFVAPAFGFQKNMHYPDNEKLEKLVERQWSVCEAFNVSIGFHSGSGKSAENYQVMGRVTRSNLEIKTSGRYTYEMGAALAKSNDPDDQSLWQDWYAFTKELAIAGAFSESDTEREMAREFIEDALNQEGQSTEIFDSISTVRKSFDMLTTSPAHMFWFEYNFLYVLAADGKAEKSALGDHSPAGYRHRRRFYLISEEGKLRFAQGVASYIIFLAQNTG
ncbi:MAG: tagaturonate epimerase family protein, partial [Opitutales bacterium]|nr:tagaturonate epimerase family protein [Opitutales bacterium]